MVRSDRQGQPSFGARRERPQRHGRWRARSRERGDDGDAQPLADHSQDRRGLAHLVTDVGRDPMRSQRREHQPLAAGARGGRRVPRRDRACARRPVTPAGGRRGRRRAAFVRHEWLEGESVVVTRDHCDVNRAHPQPAHQLVVVPVEHRHRERGMSPFEAGQQRKPAGERNAWHQTEADVAARQAIRLVALLADHLGLAEVARAPARTRSPSVVGAATPCARTKRSPPSSTSSARTARLAPG